LIKHCTLKVATLEFAQAYCENNGFIHKNNVTKDRYMWQFKISTNSTPIAFPGIILIK